MATGNTPAPRRASISRSTSSAAGQAERALKSRITAAWRNSFGARSTRSRISAAKAPMSSDWMRRLAMPTWPNFTSPCCSRETLLPMSGSRGPGFVGRRPAAALQPGDGGQLAAVGGLHERIAAHFLVQHGRAQGRVGHLVLADLMEAEA